MVTAPSSAGVVDVAPRDPLPGEVRVVLEGCGVCGSNLPVWEGREWFTYPLQPGAPGHEGWGEVAAVGDGVPLATGQRVAVLADGAFATEITVPAASVVPLPDELAGRDFPGEAVGAGWNVARRGAFAAGQTVAVVGIGFLGAVVTALAAAAGARVLAVSRRAHSLDVARAMGAADVIPLEDRWQVGRAVSELTDGALCDVVVEAVGTQGPLDVAGDLTRSGGRLVIAGFHQDGLRTVDLQAWSWKGIDLVNAHERDERVVAEGVRAGAEAVVAGTVDLEPLLTHRFPLDRLGAALDAMVQRPHGFLKAVVHP
ncbi:MAG: Threonine dehydrogenase and related Zn-dependent dehydrogenases [uncultured Acidimicrobiales bacterium]|uniref:Threonine dehydrogenase and related Zn-dependent dehydrogenases n=1 Tax=uncultured Acidimicrobiales bacterium TaxID=310071 RepID=A0A6J4HPD5_9ACTN|nr:MAG: Threonine dehydrogenase and related Zn-dependent dehydrogenases [uncultured Acidimicrobiales bacterium]